MKNLSTPIINQHVAILKIKDLKKTLDVAGQIGNNLVKDLRLNVVKELSHDFQPEGITLAYILSESHLVIHTWPELGVIHIDLVTCKLTKREDFKTSLQNTLSNHNVKELQVKKVIF